MSRIVAADLFCGAGGSSTGLQQACESSGLQLDLTAINHDPIAIETHSANHPGVRHLCESLDGVDPRRVCKRLDLLVASPECFPAGTMILTRDGLVPIEELTTDDYVLTHQGRWRRVTATMKAVKDTVIVRGHGHYGLETTAEHPFYVRSRRRCWPKVQRSGVWNWSEPVWTEAGQLAQNFWATPTVIPGRPRVLPATLDGAEDTAMFWWVVGRWLGDGSVLTRPGKGGEITVCCGDHEADGLIHQLESGWPMVKWYRRKVRTATLFECRSKDLANWLIQQFGKLAYGKTLPTWALGMERQFRESLLDGYLSADGHHDGRKQEVLTVSRRLAIAVRLLAESLGHRVAMHKAAQHSDTIEGRKVTARDVYRVMWVSDRKRNYSEEIDGLAWSRVREVVAGRKDVEVYNLSVDEDESYIADGVVVHNCTHHSNARGGKPRSDQSRATGWHVVRWAEALQPRAILVENVREMLTWGPLDDRGRPLKRRRGETFQAWLTALRSLGYTVEHRILTAADHGDPTTRRRLFVCAVRGRGGVPWPEPTHARKPDQDLFGGLKPWRAAREVIDWSLKGQSIFDRKRPLREKTLGRIREGLRRFGGEAFLVPGFGERADQRPRTHGTGDPLPTVAAGGHFGLVEPFVIGQQSGSVPRPVSEPLPTVATRGAIGLVEIHRGATPDVDCNFLVRYNGTGGPIPLGEPIPTVTAKDRFGLVAFRQGLPPGVDCTDVRFRMLQPHELALAQGFPVGYRFVGNRTQQVKQIGNAVPVGTARALCLALLGVVRRRAA